MSGKIKITEEKAREIAEDWGKKIYEIQTASRKKESEEIARIYESQGIDSNQAPAVPDVESTEEELIDDIFYNLCDKSDIYEVDIKDDD